LDFEKNVKIENPIYSKNKEDINPIVKPISAIYFSHGKEKRYCSKFFFSHANSRISTLYLLSSLLIHEYLSMQTQEKYSR
jgi:hypothetical protein